tara:strand:+ start:220 stop:462 length:243 start_codon:yes stop_codon:yes gene_type:complete
MNILKNSIDSISGSRGGIITMNMVRTFSDLVLEIKDTGKGIAKEDMEFIFDPFYTTKGKEVTGLGLSVSYGIIKTHGGDI